LAQILEKTILKKGETSGQNELSFALVMKTVMYVLTASDPFYVQYLRGIRDYVHERNSWYLQINPDIHPLGLRFLERWHGDGVITSAVTRAEIAAARALPQPVVNLSGAIQRTGLPRVMNDHRAMGQIAAEHLLACGLSHFAYYGERNRWYSELRKRGFRQRVAEAGHSCRVLEYPTAFNRQSTWYRWLTSQEQWLRSLPLPVGLLTVHDFSGAVVIETCARLGLRVPEDIAVIGIGNDLITCEFSAVSLSSVDRNCRAVGYQAAALLDHLMEGQSPPEQEILVPPEGVVPRRSTDMIAVEDPRVAAAVAYIREHLRESLTVNAILRKLDISRRALEICFDKSLGCTPSDYITLQRIERAKNLLSRDVKLKLQQIARLCGFSSPRHFRDVFQRIAGMTPTEYRSQSRLRSL
jgi:LacI family transcriptional regulator